MAELRVGWVLSQMRLVGPMGSVIKTPTFNLEYGNLEKRLHVSVLVCLRLVPLLTLVHEVQVAVRTEVLGKCL